MPYLQRICQQAGESHCLEGVREIYLLTLDKDERVAYNALWILTQLDGSGKQALHSYHNALIDQLLQETHTGKKRLLLTLLNEQPFEKEGLRTDFIDYCLQKITACAEPYALRALCMKIAFRQCRHYPELTAELQRALEMLNEEALSPGLKSAQKNVLTQIKK